MCCKTVLFCFSLPFLRPQEEANLDIWKCFFSSREESNKETRGCAVDPLPTTGSQSEMYWHGSRGKWGSWKYNLYRLQRLSNIALFIQPWKVQSSHCLWMCLLKVLLLFQPGILFRSGGVKCTTTKTRNSCLAEPAAVVKWKGPALIECALDFARRSIDWQTPTCGSASLIKQTFFLRLKHRKAQQLVHQLQTCRMPVPCSPLLFCQVQRL